MNSENLPNYLSLDHSSHLVRKISSRSKISPFSPRIHEVFGLKTLIWSHEIKTNITSPISANETLHRLRSVVYVMYDKSARTIYWFIDRIKTSGFPVSHSHIHYYVCAQHTHTRHSNHRNFYSLMWEGNYDGITDTRKAGEWVSPDIHNGRNIGK